MGRKYAVYFVTVVGLALVVMGLVQLTFTERENREAVLNLQQEQATFAAARIEAYVREIERQLGWVRFARPGGAQPEQVRIDFLKLLRQVPAITDVAYADAGGREVARVSRVTLDAVASRADLSSHPGMKASNAPEAWFGPVEFRKDTEPYMTVAVSQIGGPEVILADVNLKFIWEVVSRIAVGETGGAYVVDVQGRLVAHPDIANVLRQRDLSALPHVEAAITGAPRQATVATGPSGASVLTAHARIPSLGWTVFVEQPVAEALAPVVAAVRRTALLLLLGLVLAVLASAYVARRMVRPIRAIGKGALTLAEGNLAHRIDVRTGDELQDLAQRVNHLAERLQDMTGNLERKVEERTRESARLVTEIEHKSAQLALAGQHKSEFLASMSHELRTPLNAVIGFSEVLLERMFGELNDKQAEYLVDIHGSGKHLLSLINDILDLSKIEAGRMDLELARFSVPDVLQGTVSLLRERAGRGRVGLTLVCDPELHEWVADERKFRQILLNLLSNAIKFTPAGGSVQVEAQEADRGLQVSVKDNGIGIRAEDREVVFEEFRQASGNHLAKAEGTGLGLALTRRLVELHGGTITLASEPGQGSTFVFRLPQREAA
ncbi:sensor histidine kinase [Caenimonas sedimenti]|uniref:sensor histidine kinase n=1 Tax=Caenimonas sedimenti TaxID=2596921 RepID=UPI001648E086|nr:hybrid sensor histidine kinase/response regulator [Caenimonas sedimenti]